MRYRIYSFFVILSAILIVAAVYFLFGSTKTPQQGEIEIQAGEVYEADEEILSLEHGDPT